MSYYTTLNGDIQIEPPLTWSEVKDDQGRGHTEVGYSRDGRNALSITVDESKRETDEGTLQIKQGTHIEGLPGDPRAGQSGETARAELQEILDRYSKPGRTFVGTIEGSGEDPLDVWRLRAAHADDRWVATVDLPTITWPS
jgi:hypothetical protein